jgi:DNA-binding LacI/PurR family transcriptional regulator
VDEVVTLVTGPVTTIMDVAREAGVGVGTVSRVLNGSPLVSTNTRKRVLAAIDRLGYQPNPIARAFGGRRTDKLEILLPTLTAGFALDVLRGIQDVLAETDYCVLLRTVDHAAERDRAFAECGQRGRTEGAIVMWMPPSDALAERLTADMFPAVVLNGFHPRLSSVGVDHADAAERAVAYCAGLGHRRIALVDCGEDPFDPDSPGICHDGYARGMALAGLSPTAGYEFRAEHSAAGGTAAANAFMRLPDPPTAIIAGNVGQALGVVDTARRAGLRVPQDLSVVGYNDTRLASEFGLTTMHVPLREIGSLAAEMLLTLLTEPDMPPQIRRVSAELVVRRTCAPPSAGRAGP